MSQMLEASRNVEAHQRHATATEAADTDVVLTVPADANHIWVLDCLWFSYSATPTAGRLIVSIGETVKLDVDITQGGPGPLPLNRMNDGRPNQAVVITLKAGGSGVVGKLALQYF